MSDPTETFRRTMIESGQPEQDLARAEQRWDTEQLAKEFDVTGFLAPYVLVRRKRDGAEGTMLFTHNPRWYFDFREGLWGLEP